MKYLKSYFVLKQPQVQLYTKVSRCLHATIKTLYLKLGQFFAIKSKTNKCWSHIAPLSRLYLVKNDVQLKLANGHP